MRSHGTLTAALAAALVASACGPGEPAAPSAPISVSGLHVVGNQIRNDAGQVVQLRGVNRAGTEYACVQGWGIFDGPSDAASIQAIRGWHANAVRIPLNSQCWLGINGVSTLYGGANYQRAISDYVALLTQEGLVPILELHWTAPGAQVANTQVPMPDRDHAPTFWAQVAQAFKGNGSVVFELYNEPYPDSNRNTTAAWTCLRDGGTCPGVSYTAAGMQELVTAVRGTGARNLVLVGGVQYANALSSWLAYKPVDPGGNLAASWHVYNFNLCANGGCYDSTAAPVAASVPLVATEIGEDDCQGGFVTPLMSWLDGHGAGYVPWVWNTWNSCLSLVSSYDGTPRGVYGQTVRSHLLSF